MEVIGRGQDENFARTCIGIAIGQLIDDEQNRRDESQSTATNTFKIDSFQGSALSILIDIVARCIFSFLFSPSLFHLFSFSFYSFLFRFLSPSFSFFHNFKEKMFIFAFMIVITEVGREASCYTNYAHRVHCSPLDVSEALRTMGVPMESPLVLANISRENPFLYSGIFCFLNCHCLFLCKSVVCRLLIFHFTFFRLSPSQRAGSALLTVQSSSASPSASGVQSPSSSRRRTSRCRRPHTSRASSHTIQTSD